jgi:hypothetical protein
MALLENGASTARFEQLRALLERVRDQDESLWLERNRELAFLANALVAGSSMQSRPFTPREASEAAAATCNLGLEQRARRSPASSPEPDLVTAFEAGWSTLYQDVCVFATQQLIDTLGEVQCVDAVTQDDIRALRLELREQSEAGTPWLAADTLDVVATLDTPAWMALLGLIRECPVVSEALAAIVERRTGAVSATAFEFISTTAQIDMVRAFITRLPGLLRG